MLGDGARHAIKDALKVVQLARLLYLDDDDFTLAVLGFDVNAVELVLRVVLVALAFQQFHDVDRLVEEHGNQAFEHAEVSLVAQHTLRSPVESDESVVVHLGGCLGLIRQKYKVFRFVASILTFFGQNLQLVKSLFGRVFGLKRRFLSAFPKNPNKKFPTHQSFSYFCPFNSS